MNSEEFDVVVVGAGAAGVMAALTASQNGSRTALVDSGSFPGGELVGGLPLDSCVNVKGEWIQGGVLRRLLNKLESAGGYIGPVFDWRTMYAVCVDPEIFKLVIVAALAEAGVVLRMHSIVTDVLHGEAGRIAGVLTTSRQGQTLIRGKVVIDCSGNADVADLASGGSAVTPPQDVYQPVSLVYRLGGVDFEKYMNFVRSNPNEFLLGENPAIGLSAAECAQKAADIGLPHVALSCDGPLLSSAIESGEMYPCTFVFSWPTSIERSEVGLNTTRVAGIDALSNRELNGVIPELVEQVDTGVRFCRQSLPGFERASLTSVAPKVGIRETRRVIGEYVLTDRDVIDGVKKSDGIAKGSHHVDIHGAGTDQLRIPVADGGSYDIPYGALVPLGVSNVLTAGRLISSERGANGSARVMGSCAGTGQAAGLAGSLCATRGISDVRDLDTNELREALRGIGAVIDGTQ